MGRGGGVFGLSLGLVLAILFAACAIPALGYYVWAYLGPDLDDAKVATAHYLERIEASDYTGAYRSLCPATIRATSAQAFTAAMAASPHPVSHVLLGGLFTNEPGNEAEVDMRLTDGTGSTREVTFVVSMVDHARGTWLVCGDTLI
jgi:hypothetical protein